MIVDRFRKADLLFILLLAFAVRFSLSWHPGYGFDIGVYQGWARSGVTFGLAQSYTQQVGGNMLPDYPPLAITILTGFGHVYKFLFHEFDLYSVGYRMFIKLPAICADLSICWMLYAVLFRWKGRKAGILGSLAYALNPAAIYDTALWGQTDSVYTAFLMAAIVAWLYKRENWAAIMLACSVLFKLQGIVLFPLFAFLVADNPRTLLRFSIAGIITSIVIMIPYAMGGVLQNIFDVYFGAVGRYGNVTIGAYNFWWSLLADKGWRIESTESPFGLLSYTKWGVLLFGALYAYILWIFRKELRNRTNMEAFFFCCALLCAAFFLFLTQMHERYLFPFVAFGIPMVTMGRKIAAAYWVLIAAFTINLMGVMPLTFIDKAAFAEFDSLDVFAACTEVWMFIILMIQAHELYAPKFTIPKPLLSLLRKQKRRSA